MGKKQTKTIVRAKGGTKEEVVPVDKIVVPDLWHIAMTFPEGSCERDGILDTWHLCHDLLSHVQGE